MSFICHSEHESTKRQEACGQRKLSTRSRKSSAGDRHGDGECPRARDPLAQRVRVPMLDKSLLSPSMHRVSLRKNDVDSSDHRENKTKDSSGHITVNVNEKDGASPNPTSAVSRMLSIFARTMSFDPTATSRRLRRAGRVSQPDTEDV